MSDGPAGFAPQGDARSVGVGALGDYMAALRGGFSEIAFARADKEPVGFTPVSPAPPQPKHFSPADPDNNPTAGWNPLDAAGGRDGNPPEHDAEPLLDALDAARVEGYAAGFDAGVRQGALEADAQTAIGDRIVAALDGVASFDRDQLAAHLRQTVLYLVTRMVGEIGVAPDLLAKRIDAAVKLLADSSEPALMRLNPEDLALVEGRVPERVSAIGDKAVERGGLVIETRATAIEDGPTAWLAQLAAAIDRVALPDAG